MVLWSIPPLYSVSILMFPLPVYLQFTVCVSTSLLTFFCTSFLLRFIDFVFRLWHVMSGLCFLSTWLNWLIACFASGSQQSPGCFRAAPGLFGGQKGQGFHRGQQVGSAGKVCRISMISLTIFTLHNIWLPLNLQYWEHSARIDHNPMRG